MNRPAAWPHIPTCAREALERLADQIGALLGTTLPVSGWFDGYPFVLGIVGTYAHAAAEELLAEAELVIAVGTSLSAETTRDNRLFPRAKVLQIDAERLPAVRNIPPISSWWETPDWRPRHCSTP